MDLSEFERGFKLLRDAYGDRVFPPARENLMFKRYQKAPRGLFQAAAEVVVLHMMQPSHVLTYLDEQLRFHCVGPALPAFVCEACRDFGFGFIGDLVEACTCSAGHHVSPDELARQQRFYDKGKELFMRKGFMEVFKPLPYDPKERQGA
jgi:hypothetical protein